MLYDSNKFFGEVLDDPTNPKYNLIDASCSDKEGCVWVGGFHITSDMHKLVAKDMGSVLSKFVYSHGL